MDTFSVRGTSGDVKHEVTKLSHVPGAIQEAVQKLASSYPPDAEIEISGSFGNFPGGYQIRVESVGETAESKAAKGAAEKAAADAKAAEELAAREKAEAEAAEKAKADAEAAAAAAAAAASGAGAGTGDASGAASGSGTGDAGA